MEPAYQRVATKLVVRSANEGGWKTGAAVRTGTRRRLAQLAVESLAKAHSNVSAVDLPKSPRRRLSPAKRAGIDIKSPIRRLARAPRTGAYNRRLHHPMWPSAGSAAKASGRPHWRKTKMKIWSKPEVREQEVGLEVTSYLPAEIDII